MTTQIRFDAINRAMNALRYSLASYLWFARPWAGSSDRSIAEVIARVADGHARHATRLGELILERHAYAVSGTFPMAFTALNDLSVRHLLPLAVEDQKQIIRLIDAAATYLKRDSTAHTTAMDIRGHEQSHLELLRSHLGSRLAPAIRDDRVRLEPVSTAIGPRDLLADCVGIASEDSFPASDAPSWTGAIGTGGEYSSEMTGRRRNPPYAYNASSTLGARPAMVRKPVLHLPLQ